MGTYYNAILYPVIHSIFFLLILGFHCIGVLTTCLAKSILLLLHCKLLKDLFLLCLCIYCKFYMHLSHNIFQITFPRGKILGPKMLCTFVVLIILSYCIFRKLLSICIFQVCEYPFPQSPLSVELSVILILFLVAVL